MRLAKHGINSCRGGFCEEDFLEGYMGTSVHFRVNHFVCPALTLPAHHSTPRYNQYESVLRRHRWRVEDGSEELALHPDPGQRTFHTG